MKLCLVCQHKFETDSWRCPGCGYLPGSYQGLPIFAPELINGDGSDGVYDFADLFVAETGNFWFESRNRLLIWALRRYFSNACHLLEIGCGTGFVLAGIRGQYPELVLAGSDIMVEGLTYAGRRLGGVFLFQTDARRIPFEAEFDLVGAFDMLEHIEQDHLVLGEMFRATKPGGGIMLTVPQHPFLWSFLDEVSGHKRRYTRSELVQKVEQVGFKVVSVTSFVSFLLPLLLLSRLKQRQPRENYDPMAEFKMSRFLNESLKKVLDVERVLIQQGLSFPWGGSLLLVAKRS